MTPNKTQFEAEATAYGFDLTPGTCQCGAIVCAYANEKTSHLWAGWCMGHFALAIAINQIGDTTP